MTVPQGWDPKQWAGLDPRQQQRVLNGALQAPQQPVGSAAQQALMLTSGIAPTPQAPAPTPAPTPQQGGGIQTLATIPPQPQMQTASAAPAPAGQSSGSQPLRTGTTSVFASPEDRETQVLQMGADLYNQGIGQQFPGARPVDFSPDTLAAQQLMRDNAAGVQSQLEQVAGGITTGLNAPNIHQNPYAMAAIDAALRRASRAYTDPGGVLSNIRSGASGAGQYGGSRQGIAEGIAAREFGQTLADTSASMASQMYGQGLDTMTRTLGLAPSLMASSALPANMLSSVGTQNEGLSQAQENFRAEGDLWNLNYPWQNLSNYASLVRGGVPGAPDPGDGNDLLQAIGLGLGGYGLGREAGLSGTGALIPAGLLALAGFGG